MRMTKWIVILLCCASLFGCSKQKSDPVFYDLQGNAIQLSQAKGKWIVVNYWADWCHTCLSEIAELNNFYNHNADKNIIFVSVNFDQLADAELIHAVFRAKIHFPVLTQNPAEAWQLGDINFLPTTFIINPAGDVVKKIVGVSTEKSLLDDLSALKKSVSS